MSKVAAIFKLNSVALNQNWNKIATYVALPKLGEGFYTPLDAAKILQLDQKQARYWFRNYARRKLESGRGHRYYFDTGDTYAVNFYTLIEMFVFYSLKNYGVSAQKILTAHNVISNVLDTPYPFALQDMFVGGGEVFFNYTKGEIIRADKSMQIMMDEIIMPFCQKIEYGKDKLAEKYFPLGPQTKVVVDPKHQFGYPTIKGTNIIVDVIADMREGGESIESISKLYGISRSAVKDAVEYATAA